jgi:hypothetical protein
MEIKSILYMDILHKKSHLAPFREILEMAGVQCRTHAEERMSEGV